MLFFIIELIPEIFIVVDPPAEIVEHVVHIMCDEQPERLDKTQKPAKQHLVDVAASWSDHRRLSGEYQLLNIDKDGLIGKQTLAVIPGKRFAKG